MDARARSACYPRGTFYPLSDGASTCHRQITSPDFRPCSRCPSHSQAPLCTYTQHLIANQAEGTFGRLLKGNGGAQRFPQPGWQSGVECKCTRELDCERDISSLSLIHISEPTRRTPI